jgi:hypothetical protein
MCGQWIQIRVLFRLMIRSIVARLLIALRNAGAHHILLTEQITVTPANVD